MTPDKPVAVPITRYSRPSLYACLIALAFILSAYLCLANLDYVTFWHDEAPTVLISNNLLEQGDIVGWDGRNLVGGTNGRTLNSRLQDVLPPLMYFVSAAGISLFGFNEIGARLPHALLGLLSLWVFYLLLKQRLPGHPRAVFFCFLFAATSPQLLLFFRQSRYFAAMVLLTLTAFWLYERHWRSGRRVDLACLTGVLVLAFFNHYTACAATMLALFTYHLLLRARQTSWQQWRNYAVSTGVVFVIAATYLYYIELYSGGRQGYQAYTGAVPIREHLTVLPPALHHVLYDIRTLFTADWVSWPVFLCFLLILIIYRKAVFSRNSDHILISSSNQGSFNPSLIRGAGEMALFGFLFVGLSGALNQQPIVNYPLSDIRYMVPALPLLMPVKGVFAEWLWLRSRLLAFPVLALLLCTSAGAAPFNLKMRTDGYSTIGAHLPLFIREIHSPYPDANRLVSDYMYAHAGQDDLVYVPHFAYREVMTARLGDLVLFSCAIDETSPLPPSLTNDPAATHLHCDQPPDWIILFGLQNSRYWPAMLSQYEVAVRLDVSPYPIRPELDLHSFTPLPFQGGAHILKRKVAP